MIRNSDTRYGLVARALHWAIALAVFALLATGALFEDMARTPFKFQLINLHKATGVTVLALMLVRLLWRAANNGLPHANPTHKPWERRLAGLTHYGLYALLVAMPLSGWMMSGAANFQFAWFGLFPVHALLAPDPTLAKILAGVHGTLGVVIWIALALHVGGAIKHAIIDRDGTLRRMIGAAVVCLVMAAPYAHAANAPVWTIDQAASHLSVSATQDGSPFSARFKTFGGNITLDPATAQGQARIAIDLGSFDSQNAERDATVSDPAWFGSKATPEAVYTIDRFEKTSQDGHYIAHGRLSLHGIDRPLDLPFTLTIRQDKDVRYARAQGAVTLNRLDFNVGSGEWADTKTIGGAVQVGIDLSATAKSQ